MAEVLSGCSSLRRQLVEYAYGDRIVGCAVVRELLVDHLNTKTLNKTSRAFIAQGSALVEIIYAAFPAWFAMTRRSRAYPVSLTNDACTMLHTDDWDTTELPSFAPPPIVAFNQSTWNFNHTLYKAALLARLAPETFL